METPAAAEPIAAGTVGQGAVSGGANVVKDAQPVVTEGTGKVPAWAKWGRAELGRGPAASAWFAGAPVF